jgi:hypothetical protein
MLRFTLNPFRAEQPDKYKVKLDSSCVILPSILKKCDKPFVGSPQAILQSEIGGYERVIAWFYSLAGIPINLTRCASISQPFGRVNMIDPPAQVALDTAWNGEVPKRVVARAVVEISKDVGQAEVHNVSEPREFVRVVSYST